MAPGDMASPNAFLEALRDNRRLFFRRSRAASASASENLNPSRGSFTLRHVLML
jgi:hypothetical protein